MNAEAVPGIETIVIDVETLKEKVQTLEDSHNDLKKSDQRIWTSIEVILKKLDTQEEGQKKTDFKVDEVRKVIDDVKTEVTRNSAKQEVYMTDIAKHNEWLQSFIMSNQDAKNKLGIEQEQTNRTALAGKYDLKKVIFTTAAATIAAAAGFIKLFL